MIRTTKTLTQMKVVTHKTKFSKGRTTIAVWISSGAKLLSFRNEEHQLKSKKIKK